MFKWRTCLCLMMNIVFMLSDHIHMLPPKHSFLVFLLVYRRCLNSILLELWKKFSQALYKFVFKRYRVGFH
jgi:hypothetical protein